MTIWPGSCAAGFRLLKGIFEASRTRAPWGTPIAGARKVIRREGAPARVMLTFVVFLTGYILSQFYRSFLAVVAPEISAELHLTATDLGNISAAWFATFALAQFPVGAALDGIGPRRTLPFLMLFGIAGALLFSRAQSNAAAIVAMGLIGVGCSGGLMGPLYVFARVYPERRFASLSALTIGFGTLGNLLGGTPLALAEQAIGWRSVFVGLAAVTTLSALLIAILIRDPPGLVAAPESSASSGDRGVLKGLSEVLSLRVLWPVWPLMTVSYGILITERGLWVGPFLSEVHGLATVERGNIIFLMAAAIASGALAYGPIEYWLRARKGPVLAGTLVATACLAILAAFPSASLGLAAVLLCVFGFSGMTYGPALAHVRTFLPDRILGRGMTFANFLCMAGAGLLQRYSGVYVDNLRQSGHVVADVYAHVHAAMAAILFIAAAAYALSREKPL